MVAFNSSPTTDNPNFVPTFWKCVAVISLLIAALMPAFFAAIGIRVVSDLIVSMLFAPRGTASLVTTTFAGTFWTDCLCSSLGALLAVMLVRSYAALLTFIVVMFLIQKCCYLLTRNYLSMFCVSEMLSDNITELLVVPSYRPFDCPPVSWQSFVTTNFPPSHPY